VQEGFANGRDGLIAYWVLVFLLFVVCFLTLGGCGDDKSLEAPETTEPVMDLAVGNTWHYYSRINEPGAPVSDVIRTIINHIQIPLEGDLVSVAHEQVVTAAQKTLLPGISRLLKNESDGLYCYGFVDDEGIVQVRDRYLVAPRNAEKGDRFQIAPDVFLACVATDSLVSTDFGEFVADVFCYSLFGGTVNVPDVFVIPGIGLTRYYSIQVTEFMVDYDFD